MRFGGVGYVCKFGFYTCVIKMCYWTPSRLRYSSKSMGIRQNVCRITAYGSDSFANKRFSLGKACFYFKILQEKAADILICFWSHIEIMPNIIVRNRGGIRYFLHLLKWGACQC